MADSPLNASDGVLGVEIKLNGTALADALIVESVRSFHALNRIPEAHFALMVDAVQVEDFEPLDSDDFALGAEVEIGGTYGDGTVQTIFKGIITANRFRARSSGYRMEFTCRDKAIGMTEIRTSMSYTEVTDSDVIEAIIGDAGLTADVEATSNSAKLNLRVAATDWDFVRLMADRNGQVVMVDDATVKVAALDTSQEAGMTVTLGTDILELDVAIDAQRMLGGASASAWSEASQEMVTSEAALPADGPFGNTTNSDAAAVLSDRVHVASTAREFEAAELTAYVEARMTRAGLATVRGKVKYQGSTLVGPGDMVEIKGTGARFGGTGAVAAVEHELRGGEWTTTAHMGPPQDWVSDSFGAAAPAAEALTAPIHGLQIGKVMAVAEDPDGKQRIQITLPMIGAEPAEVWARYATPYASASHGIQFLPEVGDEVVVAFLNADPNAPIIVGSLHNATAERPEAATEDNFIKTIVTREELKVIFDDEKKIITLSTPGGHSIVMDDEETSITLTDSNGNTVVMDDSGISLTTDFDINLTAEGDINIAATGDANVSGMNVNCEADTGFVGSGGATAELSSGGTTKVEGSMVNIN